MNEKLNIQDLIDLLAEKHGMSKKNADSFVKEFFQLIEEARPEKPYLPRETPSIPYPEIRLSLSACFSAWQGFVCFQAH